MSWLKSLQTRTRLLFRRRSAEARMEEEIGFHLDMEADRLVREEGLGAEEARRRARVTFGAQDKYREVMREGRPLAWLSGLRLDLKLGTRMLLKYPVLTIASVLALTVAVALAASWFEFTTDMTRPRIPLPDAGRLVEVENRDLQGGADELRSLHDFETWRDELQSIDDLSAASPIAYNLTLDNNRFASLRGARVTENLFRLTRVKPVFGRLLSDEDFGESAPPVFVLGYEAWERLFDGDRSAIGKTVRLGTEYATLVGVVPASFGFPVNQEIWTPLRERAVSFARRQGPPLEMYGRLVYGFSMKEAQAEIALIGERTAAAYPTTHEKLRPAVQRFAQGNDMAGVAALLNLPFLLFLVVVSANVATLLFARTATRASEIALRSALGASRRRIILQLISEALVLTLLAAAVGLAAARWGLRWGMELFWEVQQQRPPFFFDSEMSATTAIYVAALAVLGAVIIGAIPGFRATRRQLRDILTQPRTTGMKFGAIATGVIVVQVALCMAFIPVAVMNGKENLKARRVTGSPADFPAEAYLSGRLTRQMDRSTPSPVPQAGARGTEDLFNEVRRRIAAVPGVLAATRASRMPGFNHPGDAIQIDDDSAQIRGVRAISVDPNFFDVMDARIVSGRPFTEGDVTSASRIAIVDETWAQAAFLGRNAIGQRFRYTDEAGQQPGPWFEIVGVVAGMDRAIGPGTEVGLFHPLRTEERSSLQIYLRTANQPAELVPQVQLLIAGLDPSLGVVDLQPLKDTWRPVERSDAVFTGALTVISAIIVLFALIGVYALMSFTVAQRAREIGIRAALGANPRRILASLFSRAMMQIGFGIVVGAVLVSLTVASSPEGRRLVAGVAAAMVAVGFIGCALPAMRALRIQPTEALRAE